MPAANLIEATSDPGAFALFSGLPKRVAVKLCNALRLLANGPRTGIGGNPAARSAGGAADHAGKVNPVIPEVVSQVASQVIDRDLAVAERVRAEHCRAERAAGAGRGGRGAADPLRGGIDVDRERCKGLAAAASA